MYYNYADNFTIAYIVHVCMLPLFLTYAIANHFTEDLIPWPITHKLLCLQVCAKLQLPRASYLVNVSYN